jgi:hypothetical protein
MSPRIVLSCTLVLAMACGGLTKGPPQTRTTPAAAPAQQGVDVPVEAVPVPPLPDEMPVVSRARPAPPLAQPVDENGRCVVKNLATDQPIATFLQPCGRWSISAHPKRPTDVVVAIDGQPARHGGKALPRLPEPDDVDFIGYDASGRVVAFTAQLVDPVPKPGKPHVGTVVVDGTPLEVEIDEMFGSVVCRMYTLEGSTWRKLGKPAPVTLHEGMSSPTCTRADGAPELAPVLLPGMDETMPLEFTELPEPPPGLAALSTPDGGSTWATVGEGLAVNVVYFEGARLNGPFARETATGWAVLPGLESDPSVWMQRREGFLLACADGAAHVYDARAGYKRVWSGTGRCPVFWPPTAG